MKIERLSKFQFLIDDKYSVDLEEFHGNGLCDCPHFTYRLQSKAERLAQAPETWDHYLRCKHILFARDYDYNERLEADFQTYGHQHKSTV